MINTQVKVTFKISPSRYEQLRKLSFTRQLAFANCATQAEILDDALALYFKTPSVKAEIEKPI